MEATKPVSKTSGHLKMKGESTAISSYVEYTLEKGNAQCKCYAIPHPKMQMQDERMWKYENRLLFICCVHSTEIKYDISKKPAHLPWLACHCPILFYIIYHMFLLDLIIWGYIPKIMLDQDGSIVFLYEFVRCVIILCFRRCDMLCVLFVWLLFVMLGVANLYISKWHYLFIHIL
jgi:hypothetical protein